MLNFLASFLTPALVAGVVTLLVNNKNEKLRARRDFITKAYDPARDDIKRAVDAALAYYPLIAAERTKLLEAKVLAAERDVRHSLTALLSLNDKDSLLYCQTESFFDDFIAALTSGSFQSANAEADLGTSLRIADAGAHLRASLLEFRSYALEKSINDDPLSTASGAWHGILRSIGRE